MSKTTVPDALDSCSGQASNSTKVMNLHDILHQAALALDSYGRAILVSNSRPKLGEFWTKSVGSPGEAAEVLAPFPRERQ